MKAVFLVVLVALCAAQRMEASPVPEDKPDLNDIIAQLKNLIQEIIDELENIDIESIIAKLEEDLAVAAQQTQHVVDAIEDRVKEAIQDLVDKAAEEGKDISPCVQGKDDELEEIKNEALAKVNGCGQEALATLAPVRANMVEIATEAQELEKEVEEAIASCSSGSEEYAVDKEVAKCIVSKLMPLQSRMVKLGLKAYAVAKEAKAAYEAASARSDVCVNAALVQASLNAARIAAEVAVCVAKA